MKKLAIILMALALTACGGGGGGAGGTFPILPTPPVAQPEPEPPKPVPVCTVELYGDSIMFGGYEIIKRLYLPPAINLKRQRPNYRVIDYSYNGGNASTYFSKFLNQPLDSRFIVLQFGINDMGNGMPYEYAMRQMLERTKALKKEVIITGLIGSASHFPRYKEYNDIAKSLANEYGATWGGWDEVVYDPKTDTPDGLHPSQDYSTRLVERLALTLDTVAPECK